MRAFRFLIFLGYLICQIIKGSLQVAHSAWFSRKTIAMPAIVAFELRANSDFEVSALASSITITPGTLVLGVAAGDRDKPATLFVHSLFDNDRNSVLDGLRTLETYLLNGLRTEKVS